ncbi:MAG: nucleoside phosphorylase [Candidatus Heimdallarchaeota archaeon]|nr:MAG: nucleoside phosphorylase [Candidatus Heimdallarchaeota archaeon]
MAENKIQPHIQLSKVNRICFLCGNPDRVSRIASFLNEKEKIAENRGLIAFNGKTPNKNVPVTVLTTGMGCPSTAIILEEAFRAGGKVFIRIGSCGALKPGIRVGDIVIPHAAIRDERTSLNLAPVEFPATSSPDIYQKLFESAKKLNIEYYSGIVWTTDVYYSSNQDEYKNWARCGANSVEMESALIFIFGSVKGLEIGSILVVDGNLAEGSQKSEETMGERDEIFQKGERNAIKIALKAIEELIV